MMAGHRDEWEFFCRRACSRCRRTAKLSISSKSCGSSCSIGGTSEGASRMMAGPGGCMFAGGETGSQTDGRAEGTESDSSPPKSSGAAVCGAGGAGDVIGEGSGVAFLSASVITRSMNVLTSGAGFGRPPANQVTLPRAQRTVLPVGLTAAGALVEGGEQPGQTISIVSKRFDLRT